MAVGLVGGVGIVLGHPDADVLGESESGAGGGGPDENLGAAPGDRGEGNFVNRNHFFISHLNSVFKKIYER